MTKSRAARSSAWAMLGQLGSVITGLANFLLLARLLGPADYGLVAGAWGLVLTVGPVMTLGSERLVVRDYTVSEDAAAALGAGLLSSIAGATVGVLVLVVLHPVLLPQVPLALLAALAVAEILATGITGCLIALSFAVGDARSASIANVLVNAARLAAVLVFALSGEDDPVRWAVLYAAISLGTAGLQLVWGCWRYGRPTVVGYRLWRRVKEGLPFSAGTTAGIAHMNADRILLVRFGAAEDAGLYSVASRLATMASLPVLAVLQAMHGRYFAVGAQGGLAGTVAFGRRLLPPLAAYGVFAGVALVAGAFLLPTLLGEEYAQSAPVLVLLAPLPLIRVLQSLSGDALTGAGQQGTRTTCATVAAVVSIGLNVILIPPLGLTGVVIALFASQILLLLLLSTALRRSLKSADARNAGRSAAGV